MFNQNDQSPQKQLNDQSLHPKKTSACMDAEKIKPIYLQYCYFEVFLNWINQLDVCVLPAFICNHLLADILKPVFHFIVMRQNGETQHEMSCLYS